MKNILKKLTLVAGLLTVLGGSSVAQEINPTPYFTNFHDTLFSSTFNGELLPVGSIITAYDPDSVLCGLDTVTMAGAFGFMPVYGDEPVTTPGLDEGAETNDTITFKINGITATVVSGDPIWADQTSQNVQLAVSGIVVDLSLVDAPYSQLVAPAGTATFKVDVCNEGDALDFYGVKLNMSVPGGTGQNDWEALEPDSVVYADPGDTVSVFFSIRAPLWHTDTVNTITYSVFSNLDTTVTVDSTVDVFMSITDVGDPDIALPHSFTLFQNYPNPFNPTTTIAFNMAAKTVARLEIIDILGRTVDSRDLGVLSTGPYEVVYDASELSSGVYFYRLVTEVAAESKKMILVK